MKGEISHKGRVLEVTPDVIRVEMISSSACSACHAAGLCSMSESVKKVVEIPGTVLNVGVCEEGRRDTCRRK